LRIINNNKSDVLPKLKCILH